MSTITTEKNTSLLATRKKVEAIPKLALTILDLPCEEFKTSQLVSSHSREDLEKQIIQFSDGKERISLTKLKKRFGSAKLGKRVGQSMRVRLTGRNFTLEDIQQALLENNYVLVDELTFIVLLKLCSTSPTITEFLYLLSPYVCTSGSEKQCQFVFPQKAQSDHHFTYKKIYRDIDKKELIEFVDVLVVHKKVKKPQSS